MSLHSLSVLEFTEDAVESIRKYHDLHQPGRMDEAIDILSEWAKKQEHFIKMDIPRDYLERIIISTKGSLEKAKLRLDKLCTLRTLAPKYFQDQDFNEVKHILDGFKLLILPKYVAEHYRVYLVKGTAKHLTPDDFLYFYKYSTRLAEYWMKYDYPNGFILVFDYTDKDFNISDFITRCNPSELHQHIATNIKVYGARIKSIHLVTSSKLTDAIVTLIKPFFGAKLANRFYVHKKMEEVFETVPKDVFPVDYGGKEISIAELHEKWFSLINSQEYRNYMKEISKEGTDESRRLKEKLNDEYLGMPGTFRTIKID